MGPKPSSLATVILAGGQGTRMQGAGDIIPKPMLLVNGKPMIWHIIQHYHHYGVREFYIATGDQSQVIEDWVTKSADAKFEGAKLTVVYTGEKTKTGGRIKAMEKYIDGRDFFMTYGDGLSNINIRSQLEVHNKRLGLVLLSAVRPIPRFGALDLGGWVHHNARQVFNFSEKAWRTSTTWINGGFMVIGPGIFKFIRNQDTNFERTVLPVLSKRNLLVAYHHEGFWKCVDAPRDLRALNRLGRQEEVPWLNLKK